MVSTGGMLTTAIWLYQSVESGQMGSAPVRACSRWRVSLSRAWHSARTLSQSCSAW